MSKQQHDATRSALIEFVTVSNRFGFTPNEIAAELETLGAHGADWPPASARHWLREIEKCIEDGALILVDGRISIPTSEVEPKQLELF